MIRKWLFTIFSIVIIVVLTACGTPNMQEGIAEDIGIDLSNGQEISSMENHGGFHGDGTTSIVLKFSDDNVLEQIKDNSRWKVFPLDETASALVYGISDAGKIIGPYLTDEEGKGVVPEIQNGYYLLVDRQPEELKKEEPNMLARPSFNFTLAIYDLDAKIFYYYKFDT